MTRPAIDARVALTSDNNTRERLKALMSGHGEESDLRSDLVRLAARLIIEEGLEGEATDALGREYYGRGAAPGVGYRNGHRTGRLKTAEGVVFGPREMSDLSPQRGPKRTLGHCH